MVQYLNSFGEPEVMYLPLELAEATETIGNFDNAKHLVNSKYYCTMLKYTYPNSVFITFTIRE